MSTHLWHPFADMAAVKDDEVVIARGEGVRVWDDDGREYLDATAGLWYCNVGHGRAEIADAAAAADARRSPRYDDFRRLANRPALELAERRRRDRADGRRGRVLRQRRLRRGRHRGQAGAPLLGARSAGRTSR